MASKQTVKEDKKKTKAQKARNALGLTPTQQEGMNKLDAFMKKQAKSLDFSLGSHLMSEREGRNGATPTSSLAVDLITGGGIPKHRLTTISGPEHSGKTTLMQSAMAHQIQKGTLTHYLDFEGAADGSWMKNGTGVDFEKYEGKNFFPILDMPTGDDAFRYMSRLQEETMDLGLSALPELTHLFALDSIPSLVPEELLENDESGSKPYIAIMLSKWLPLVRAKLKAANSSFIAINQIRQKVRLQNKYEDPNYEPGGNAIKFLADLKLRFDVQKPKRVDEGDYPLVDKDKGIAVPKAGGLWLETNPDGSVDQYVYRKVKTLKNRVFPSLKETYLRICTSHKGGEGRGIDPVFDTLRFFEEIGRLEWVGKAIMLDDKKFEYFDLKQEIEKPGSELRQEALSLMDSGKAFEAYFARLGGDIGKVTPEDQEGEDSNEGND